MAERIYERFFRWSKRYSRRGLYEYLESRLAPVQAEMTLLNVGAGGEVETRIRTVVDTRVRTGSEPNVLSLDNDALRDPDVVGDVCQIPFPAESFDVVCLMEVLEHVHDPRAAVNEIYRVLKPGGLLIFSVPFLFPLHDRPHDYFRFTKYGLRLLLQNFDGVEIVERNGYFEAASVLIMRLIREKGYRPKVFAMLLMLSGLARLARVFDSFVRTDAATTGYVGSARKTPNRSRQALLDRDG